MAADLPNLKRGQLWSQQTAVQWRAMVDEVRRLRTIIDQMRGLNMPSGARIEKPRQPSLLEQPVYKTVAIVRKPLPQDSVVIVRALRYRNAPPLPCTRDGETKTCYYEWDGGIFHAYPPMWRSPADYAGDEYAAGFAEGSSPPPPDSRFHRLHREAGVWVFDDVAPSEPEAIFVRVIDYIGADPARLNGFLRVQRMKEEPVPDTNVVRWIDDGDAEDAQCWPNFTPNHYLRLRGLNPELLFRLVPGDGTNYVEVHHRFMPGAPVGNVPASDCLAAVP